MSDDQVDQYEDKPSLYKALRGLIMGEEFVNPYRFGTAEDLLSEPFGKPALSKDNNPRKFIDRSDPSYQESIFAEPTELSSLDTGGIAGQIRGLPNKLSKIVRKAMQNELKARGPAPFEARITENKKLVDTAKFSNDADALEFMKSYKEHMPNASTGTFYTNDPKLPVGAEVFDKAPLDEAAITSRLLRQTWYRGQDKYPSEARLERVLDPSTGKEVEEYVTKQWGKEYGTEAPVFAGLRAKQSNLGEPHGISLSYDPNVSTGFGAPPTITEAVKDEVIDMAGRGLLPDSVVSRAARLADTQKVSRVMPLYGEAPEGKILQAWKPEHGAEFRQAYVDSASEMASKYPEFRKQIENLPPGASGNDVKTAIGEARNTWTQGGEGENFSFKHAVKSVANDEKYRGPGDELNSLMSKKLMERGYKGMLHSPHRYQEYELRMFDPYDVMYLDKRAVNSSKYSNNPMSSKAVARLDEMKSALKREHETVTEGKSKTLADWYRDITREEILGLPKASNEAVNEAIGSKYSKLVSDISDVVGDTGHGDMADKVAPTAAMLEWGKQNKLKQSTQDLLDKLKLKNKKLNNFEIDSDFEP